MRGWGGINTIEASNDERAKPGKEKLGRELKGTHAGMTRLLVCSVSF